MFMLRNSGVAFNMCILAGRVLSGNTLQRLAKRLCEMHQPVRIDYVRNFSAADDLVCATPCRWMIEKTVSERVPVKTGEGIAISNCW